MAGIHRVRWICLIGLSLSFIFACSEDSKPEKTALDSALQNTLTVYKTPSCGCCSAWVDHVQEFGFKADVVKQDSVAHVKDRFAIPANARSCHTAVTDQNYVFEGHVPAKYIQQFLAETPDDGKGLIVPAMPLGSPGMEYEDQFNPYQIWMLKSNGELELYASIGSYEEQF